MKTSFYLVTMLIIAGLFSCRKSDKGAQCQVAPKGITFSAAGKIFTLPSALTPNGDGRNDRFRGVGDTSIFKSLSFSIKTTEGTVLFSTTAPASQWPGTDASGKAVGGLFVLDYTARLYTSAATDTIISGSACIRSFTETNAQGCLKLVDSLTNYIFEDQIDPATGKSPYTTGENFCR